jgi:hypothetical protein
MMGQHLRVESLCYYFRLEDQIREDHLLRLIDRYADFSFVRERLKDFYSPTGYGTKPKGALQLGKP